MNSIYNCCLHFFSFSSKFPIYPLTIKPADRPTNSKATQNSIMKYTCDLASLGIDSGHGPFACVILDDKGEMIGKGNNMVALQNDPTQHAEIVAIRNACHNTDSFSLQGSTLYTSCEPCPMCLSAIYWAHIDKVYYGNNRIDACQIGFDDRFIYEELGLSPESRAIPCKQIEANYAKSHFTKWQEKTNKKKY